jgi:hypothetical protein
VFAALGGRERFESTDVRLIRSDRPDADRNDEATAKLIITVKDQDAEAVGRRFAAAVNGIGLAIYPGNYNEIVIPQASEYGVMWPTLVPASLVTQRIVVAGEEPIELSCTPAGGSPDTAPRPPAPKSVREWASEPTQRAPLGALLGARSGDKGGNANVGVWARSDEAYEWLAYFLTSERLHELLPETAELRIDRYELPNLRALNFIVQGILGEGVAATTRPDAQAKSLGEFLRSRSAELPSVLLADARVPAVVGVR